MQADGAEKPIVFALANPTPEIHAGGCRAIRAGDGHRPLDYPNQINNLLLFPGVFRGWATVRASRVNEEMKVAAAHAIAVAS